MKKNLSLTALALCACAFAASVSAETGNPVAELPEPGTLVLLAAGLAGVVAVRLIKRK